MAGEVEGLKQKPAAIFLMGPTASGKTDLAMMLSDQLPVEIISVDSALIYKDMSIGTAKPSTKELAAYPHHLIDILDPAESYSAAQFREDALALMEEITQRGKIPLLVGGTMMYFKVLLEGMSELPQASSVIREEIEKTANDKGWEFVHQQLASVDQESAQRIHPNDPQRLQRALEVYRLSGKTMTEHRLLEQQQKDEFPFNVVQFALAPEQRATLHQRIAARFERMLDDGFEAEVQKLYQRKDLHQSLPSIRAVGYRQMWQYLEGELSWEEMHEKGVVATRQLAKRQFTWLRGWQSLNWLYTREADEKSSTSKEQLLAPVLQEALGIVKRQLNS